MCGRAAQTLRTASLAAVAFDARQKGAAGGGGGGGGSDADCSSGYNSGAGNAGGGSTTGQPMDNYNLCPGMDALVMWKDDDGKIVADRKYWGLVPKGGTPSKPLPSNTKERMSLHFHNLMYNARSDTLYSKPTFSRLATQGRSCIVALDGYFEWKTSPLGGGKGKKEPYFVYRKGEEVAGDDKSKPRKYLLFAGLWTTVSTGVEQAPTLDTFTILTTEACHQIQWLHHRMPVCIWDDDLAVQWLESPSPKVQKLLSSNAWNNNEGFDWHRVTTNMSSVKYRNKDAVARIPDPVSVASFFGKTSTSSSGSGSRKGKPSNEKMATKVLVDAFAIRKPTAAAPPKTQGKANRLAKEVGTKKVVAIPPDTTPRKRSLPSANVKSSSSSTTPSAKKSKVAKAAEGKKGLITSFFNRKT